MRGVFRSSSFGVVGGVWVGVGVGLACGLLASVQQAAFAGGGVDPNSGIDFVRITHPNNAPWMGTNPPTPGDRAVGRGSVGYEYSIGKFEVTTAQWVEFFNAAYDRPDAASNPLPFLLPPQTWGAAGATPINGGSRRWRVPAGNEMIPVGDIGWRMGAMYCNWLHNNKGTDRAAFMSGAYDVSTFGFFGNTFTDQATHSPGARYWIPTWDEWLKAAHYDPNKNGPGQEGWWRYSTTSDTAPIAGPPASMAPQSLGQVNTAGGQFYGVSPFSIPLGAYSNVTSPWGLYDVAGATMEWTEEVLTGVTGVRFRVLDGSWWLDGDIPVDMIGNPAADDFPNVFIFDRGLRIASAVPSPLSSSLLVFAGALAAIRRRKACICEAEHHVYRCVRAGEHTRARPSRREV